MPLDTELHKSAHKGDLQLVRDLLLSGEIHVNARGAQDRTALHRAAGANHVEIIDFLLQAGAPVDCVDRRLRTPLHWAAISGNMDATQLLLASGGDLRRKTMSGMNPLMCAVQQGWHTVAETILEWSASLAEDGGDDEHVPTPAELCCMADTEGKTVTAIAKEAGDVPMQKLLKVYAPRAPPMMCCGFRNSRTTLQRHQHQPSAAAGTEAEAGRKPEGLEGPQGARVSERRGRRGQDAEGEDDVDHDGQGGKRRRWCRWLCCLASFAPRHKASPREDREGKPVGPLEATMGSSASPPTSFGDGNGDGDDVERVRKNNESGGIGTGSGSSEADEAQGVGQEKGASKASDAEVVNFSLDESNSSDRTGQKGARLSVPPTPARRISPAPVKHGSAPSAAGAAMADAARGSDVWTGLDGASPLMSLTSLRTASGGGDDGGGVREARPISRASAGGWRGLTSVKGVIADGGVFEEDGRRQRQRRCAEVGREGASENVAATSERRSRGSRSVGRFRRGFGRTSKEMEGSLGAVEEEIRKSAAEFAQCQPMAARRCHRSSLSEPSLPRIPRLASDP